MRFVCVFVLLAAITQSGCWDDWDDVTGPLEGTPVYQPVPFTGSISASVNSMNLEGRAGCPVDTLPVDVSGHGNATEIGAFTVVYEHCSYTEVNAANPSYVGAATMTVGNGDELFFTYDGMRTSPTTYVENATFSGGTGRFEGVSGTFVHTGEFREGGSKIYGTFEGRISPFVQIH